MQSREYTDRNGVKKTAWEVTANNIYDEAKTITLSEIEGVTLAESVFEGVPAGETVKTLPCVVFSDQKLFHSERGQRRCPGIFDCSSASSASRRGTSMFCGQRLSHVPQPRQSEGLLPGSSPRRPLREKKLWESR